MFDYTDFAAPAIIFLYYSSIPPFVHPLLYCTQWNISNGCIVLATGGSEQLVTASLWQMSVCLFVAQAPPPDGLMLEGWGNYIRGLLGKLGTSLTASDRCGAGVPFSCFSFGVTTADHLKRSDYTNLSFATLLIYMGSRAGTSIGQCIPSDLGSLCGLKTLTQWQQRVVDGTTNYD